VDIIAIIIIIIIILYCVDRVTLLQMGYLDWQAMALVMLSYPNLQANVKVSL